ncbi:MAG: YggS family pyridoxal phosphate-dependent enzyme [Gammaproteobacteria bacterium]|nr:YggS family pyridoxal phosphate-dependent enzyme [Gammaproteobacteria bacterium]
MNEIEQALTSLRTRIAGWEARYGRPEGSVRLLAVSKTKPPAVVEAAYRFGQRDFGENHLQDAQVKLDALGDLDICWHFIGPIQSNKTRPISAEFDWVHSIDRMKIARRLSDQRPENLPPLEVCVQVNISGEDSKSGVDPEEAPALAADVARLPGLRLRGLMAIPRPEREFSAQREPFRRLRRLLEDLNERGLGLDTLSMGMTDDLEAAIAEGATIVRVGTAIFGPR